MQTKISLQILLIITLSMILIIGAALYIITNSIWSWFSAALIVLTLQSLPFIIIAFLMEDD